MTFKRAVNNLDKDLLKNKDDIKKYVSSISYSADDSDIPRIIITISNGPKISYNIKTRCAYVDYKSNSTVYNKELIDSVFELKMDVLKNILIKDGEKKGESFVLTDKSTLESLIDYLAEV